MNLIPIKQLFHFFFFVLRKWHEKIEAHETAALGVDSPGSFPISIVHNFSNFSSVMFQLKLKTIECYGTMALFAPCCSVIV